MVGALEVICLNLVGTSPSSSEPSSSLLERVDRIAEAFAIRAAGRAQANETMEPSLRSLFLVAELMPYLVKAVITKQNKLPRIIADELASDISKLTVRNVVTPKLERAFAVLAMVCYGLRLVGRPDGDCDSFVRLLALSQDEQVDEVDRCLYLSLATRFFGELGEATKDSIPLEAENYRLVYPSDRRCINWNLGLEHLKGALLNSTSESEAAIIHSAMRRYGAAGLFMVQISLDEGRHGLSDDVIQLTRLNALDELQAEGREKFVEFERSAPTPVDRICKHILGAYMRDENPVLQACALQTLVIIAPYRTDLLRRIKNLRHLQSEDPGSVNQQVAEVLENLSAELLRRVERGTH